MIRDFTGWLTKYPDRTIEPWKVAAGHAGLIAFAALLHLYGVSGPLAAAIAYAVAIALEYRDSKIYGFGLDGAMDLVEYLSVWIVAFSGVQALLATAVYLVLFLAAQIVRFAAYGLWQWQNTGRRG